MQTTNRKIRFYAKETSLIESNAPEGLELVQSYIISNNRSSSQEVQIEMDPNKMVELVFDDNTTWFGNSDVFDDVFPEQAAGKRGINDLFDVPLSIESDDQSRGIIKKIALKVINVFAKKAIQVGVKTLATRFEEKSLEGQSGLYWINENFELKSKYIKKESDQPYLLFLHGTGSSTTGSFAELNTENKSLWMQMLSIYGDRILGFQHETLTKSPIQNVRELIDALPTNTKLDLISHSRGGLVGELLVRFSEYQEGFTDTVLSLLERQHAKADADHVRAIRQSLKKKKIQIGKFVRVACPAGGTSLMGQRIENYFNVLINVLSIPFGSKASPLVSICKEMIAEIVNSKNETDVLPGLESMNPESLFIKVLRSPGEMTSENPYGLFQNRIAVISGNGALSISLGGLSVLLSKMLFQAKNDLIVNTNSMYLGLMRQNPVQYFFDEGTDVNHFSYFKNKKTQDAIAAALNAKTELIPSFAEYRRGSADESVRGILGIEYGRIFNDQVSGKKPIIVLIPGIMGSALEKNNSLIWLHYLRMMMGDLSQLDINEKNIEATGLIKTSYKKLTDYLSDTYDVVTFPYDWRKSVAQAGVRLDQVMQRLSKHNQTVHIIAHSMGGLVARDFIFRNPQLWKDLNKRPQFRFIMLGTPWMGSYRIPYVLSGKDSMVKLLGKIDFQHHIDELINMFAKYPGLLNLMPVNKDSHDFSKAETWRQFQQASGLQWNMPDEKTLNEFATFRSFVQSNAHKIDFSNVIYVAGKDDNTPNGFNITHKGELQFTGTAEGDQSVTWATGIPENINRDTALYFTAVTHGGLANDNSLFKGIRDLLHTGTTNQFVRKPELIPAKKRQFVLNDTRVFESDEENGILGILGLPTEVKKEEAMLAPLKVSVTRGDLKYSRYPIILGHFNRDGILNAEYAADIYLKRAMSVKHRLGVYPGPVGTYDFFITPNAHEASFKGAIIIGLGEIERFSQQHLSISVEKACISYLLNRQEADSQKKKVKGISVLIIGAGYGKLTIESSCMGILQGIANANAKTLQLQGQNIRPIEHVEFVELYDDKAIQCFQTLDRISKQNFEGLAVEWMERKLRKSYGNRNRLTSESSTEWWQRLTVLNQQKEGDSNYRYLSFYSSTASAREERQDLRSNIHLLEEIIDKISTQEKWTPEESKVIFEMLIPNDFKENISSRNSILWVLDKYTATYPWELLQASLDKNKPLCVSSKMIRQLATMDYRNVVYSSKGNQVLIIGDPDLEGFSAAQQLSGAAREAESVYLKLKKEIPNIPKPIIFGKSSEIIKALHVSDYKVVHISAHGIFDAENNQESGILIGKYMDGKKEKPLLLTTNEFNQMQVTPEMVFINCCFSGTMDQQAEEFSRHRTRLAANIGTQLIEMGVKAVVVTGWAVDDQAALEFANVFYESMLAGDDFGTSVRNARKETFNKFKYTNTWGAYQCYGDPFYRLVQDKKPSANIVMEYDIPQEAKNDIINLLSKADIDFYNTDGLYKELELISKRIEKSDIDDADILEEEAYAYSEFNRFDIAIPKYEKLFTLEKATFNVKSIEKYCNISCKHILSNFLDNSIAPGSDEATQMGAKISGIVHKINLMQQLNKTSERYALLGSAYKKWAIIEPHQFNHYLKISAGYYQLAYAAKGSEMDMYSFCNWITLEQFILDRAWGEKVSFTVNDENFKYTLPEQQQILDKLQNHIDTIDDRISSGDRNYWDMVSKANAYLCLYLISEETQRKKILKMVKDEYRAIWVHAGDTNKKKTESEFFETLAAFALILNQEEIATEILSINEDLKSLLLANA